VKFSYDFGTYFLFWVRGLRSDQDEGKYQDGGKCAFFSSSPHSERKYLQKPDGDFRLLIYFFARV